MAANKGREKGAGETRGSGMQRDHIIAILNEQARSYVPVLCRN